MSVISAISYYKKDLKAVGTELKGSGSRVLTTKAFGRGLETTEQQCYALRANGYKMDGGGTLEAAFSRQHKKIKLSAWAADPENARYFMGGSPSEDNEGESQRTDSQASSATHDVGEPESMPETQPASSAEVGAWFTNSNSVALTPALAQMGAGSRSMMAPGNIDSMLAPGTQTLLLGRLLPALFSFGSGGQNSPGEL
jgi:hypothetical protein